MPDAPPLPPIAFRDSCGRDWLPVFDDDAVEWLRECGGFDLEAAAAGDDAAAILDLMSSPERLGTLLIVTCFRQAGWSEEDAAGEAGRDLREAIPPDDAGTTTRAIEAIVWAIGRRFPGSEAVRRISRTLPAFRREYRKRQHESN